MLGKNNPALESSAIDRKDWLPRRHSHRRSQPDNIHRRLHPGIPIRSRVRHLRLLLAPLKNNFLRIYLRVENPSSELGLDGLLQ